MSAQSDASSVYPEFKGFVQDRPFFTALRSRRVSPKPHVKHDVPAIVIPSRYELSRMTSRTPRTEILTLPPIHSHTARVGDVPANTRGLAATPLQGAVTALPILPKLALIESDLLLKQKSAPPRRAAVASQREKGYAADDSDSALTAERNRQEIERFEAIMNGAAAPSVGQGGTNRLGEHHTVTTIDEEASTRVLKVMFQLHLTRNSNIIARLKELDTRQLQRKLAYELGNKRQLSRDDFYTLICKVLKDDYVNKRDCMTLFSVFDDDKSGLVDSVEFVSGFMTLVAAGEHDIAFKFIHTVLDSRGEKAIVNAFISRFEIQLLVAAAQHHFSHDPDIVSLLETIPSSFNFSHHLGRIPIVKFRDKITRDPDLLVIFSALPNPSTSKSSAKEALSANGRLKSVTLPSYDPAAESRNDSLPDQAHIIADQFLCTNTDQQLHAEEHDSPRWWLCNGIVYRASESNPFPQPVFMSKDGDKRR